MEKRGGVPSAAGATVLESGVGLKAYPFTIHCRAAAFLRRRMRTYALFSAGVLGLAGLLAACSAGDTAEPSASFPTYEEGGSLELQIQGQPVSIKITEAWFNNTDVGYPDYIELSGPDTYLQAKVEPKIEDGPDGLSDYKPILNKAVPIGGLEGADPLTLGVPGVGKYAVTGGTVTLTRYDHGMEGRVLWEGNMSLNLTTGAGPATAAGTFKFGIVPLW